MSDVEKPISGWKRTWKWVVGGFTALVAIAGFANPEFRGITCLDLPAATALEYGSEAAGARRFEEIATQSQQARLDQQQIVFRARYYGETLASMFTPMLGPDKQHGYAFLNLRPLGFVPENTPLGSTESGLPKALVILPVSAAGALSNLPNGALVEVRGVGHYLSAPESGAQMEAFFKTSRAPLPDANDFYVLATEVRTLKPLNDPEDRFLCRLFHDLK